MATALQSNARQRQERRRGGARADGRADALRLAPVLTAAVGASRAAARNGMRVSRGECTRAQSTDECSAAAPDAGARRAGQGGGEGASRRSRRSQRRTERPNLRVAPGETVEGGGVRSGASEGADRGRGAGAHQLTSTRQRAEPKVHQALQALKLRRRLPDSTQSRLGREAPQRPAPTTIRRSCQRSCAYVERQCTPVNQSGFRERAAARRAPWAQPSQRGRPRVAHPSPRPWGCSTPAVSDAEHSRHAGRPDGSGERPATSAPAFRKAPAGSPAGSSIKKPEWAGESATSAGHPSRTLTEVHRYECAQLKQRGLRTGLSLRGPLCAGEAFIPSRPGGPSCAASCMARRDVGPRSFRRYALVVDPTYLR